MAKTNARRTWWIAVSVALIAVAVAASGAFAQQGRADTVAAAPRFAGVWEARSPNPAFAGTLFLHLELQQRGDSVVGTAVLQQQGETADSPWDIAGVASGDHVKLADRRRQIMLDGTLRDGRFVTRVNSGTGSAMESFQAVFSRIQP